MHLGHKREILTQLHSQVQLWAPHPWWDRQLHQRGLHQSGEEKQLWWQWPSNSRRAARYERDYTDYVWCQRSEPKSNCKGPGRAGGGAMQWSGCLSLLSCRCGRRRFSCKSVTGTTLTSLLNHFKICFKNNDVRKLAFLFKVFSLIRYNFKKVLFSFMLIPGFMSLFCYKPHQCFVPWEWVGINKKDDVANLVKDSLRAKIINLDPFPQNSLH